MWWLSIKWNQEEGQGISRKQMEKNKKKIRESKKSTSDQESRLRTEVILKGRISQF